MQYIIIAIVIAFISSVNLFFPRDDTQEKMELGSASYYAEQLRIALTDLRRLDPTLEKEISFAELTELPEGLKKRDDVRSFVDANGLYIAFSPLKPGLANKLVEKYTYSNVNEDNKSKFDIVFYHIGFNRQGCLETTRNYLYEDGSCRRPLPAAIADGALVMTDRDQTHA